MSITIKPGNKKHKMEHLYKKSSIAINEKIDYLAQLAVDRQYALQSELWTPYKQIGYSKSIRDGSYHFAYLSESLAANDSAIFLDYIAWAKVLFAGLNLPQEALKVALDCMNQALQETLAPELADLACSYINTALDHLPNFPEILESFILPDSPLFKLSSDYLALLRQGEKYTASRLILDAVTNGVSVKDIYLFVFQPCQQEIGRLWQMNQISVAQEHYCTAVTQMVISQLYPTIFNTQKNGHRLVASSVSEELHEIGIRMVVDFLEMEGWDTYYLGANTPVESIIKTLHEQKAEVLAVSATLSLHISKVAELIDQVRSSFDSPSVKILVGGYPFNLAVDLWKQVGADEYAANAQEAVRAANRFLGTV